MTNDMILLTIAPGTVERARRLEFACRALRAGDTPSCVRNALRECHGVSRMTAWRIVAMAMDLTA